MLFFYSPPTPVPAGKIALQPLQKPKSFLCYRAPPTSAEPESFFLLQIMSFTPIFFCSFPSLKKVAEARVLFSFFLQGIMLMHAMSFMLLFPSPSVAGGVVPPGAPCPRSNLTCTSFPRGPPVIFHSKSRPLRARK